MKLMLLLWLSSLTSNTPVARKSYKPMNKKLMLGNMRQILQGSLCKALHWFQKRFVDTLVFSAGFKGFLARSGLYFDCTGPHMFRINIGEGFSC